MAGTFSQIYIHYVFAVKRRENLLQKSWLDEVFKYMSGIIKAKQQKPIIVNGVSDHVHVFVGLKPSMPIADLFWPFGKFNNKPFVDLETWDIPAGSAAVALYQFISPGEYVLLNHNLIEAIVFGANATIKVEGKEDNDLMKVISPVSKY